MTIMRLIIRRGVMFRPNVGRNDKYLRLNQVFRQLPCPWGNLRIRATKFSHNFQKNDKFHEVKAIENGIYLKMSFLFSLTQQIEVVYDSHFINLMFVFGLIKHSILEFPKLLIFLRLISEIDDKCEVKWQK